MLIRIGCGMLLRMTLRDRKKARTRQAIIDAATDLFATRGYEETTIADIAAAADIGTRTFFSYFASKEEVLFPESDARVRAAVDAIRTREPGDGPAEVLLRALRNAQAPDDDMVGRLAALRMDFFYSVPAVRGRGLQIQLDAQVKIAEYLHDAYPDQLDKVTSAALVGAFIGAAAGAVQAVLADPEQVAAGPEALKKRVQQATDVALRPWSRSPDRR
jgi:AcrR family transcriptional regulator